MKEKMKRIIEEVNKKSGDGWREEAEKIKKKRKWRQKERGRCVEDMKKRRILARKRLGVTWPEKEEEGAEKDGNENEK